jgi:hypothetical protein
MIPSGGENGLLLALEKDISEGKHRLDLRPKSPMVKTAQTVTHAHLKARSRDLRNKLDFPYQQEYHLTTMRHDKEVLSS